MKQILPILTCFFTLFFCGEVTAQDSIPQLTPEDHAIRKKMTGEMYRHQSLDSFRLMMHREYAAATNDVSREKILEFWANQLVVTFGAYQASNQLIDSLLALPKAALSEYSRQSLQVRQFSNYSDQKKMEELSMLTDTFLVRINTNNLRLNDAIDYFILAIVLGEINEYSAAQKVLSTIAYHSKDEPFTLWRSYLTMAYMYIDVSDYGKALEKVEQYLPLTDTSRMNAIVCGSAYALASTTYDRNEQYESAYLWAERALDNLTETQIFEYHGSRANLCRAAVKLNRETADSICSIIISELPDTTLPDYVRANLNSVAFAYALHNNSPINEIKQFHAYWGSALKARDAPDAQMDAAYLDASLRLRMLQRQDSESLRILDSLNILYAARIEDKATRINNDLAEKYQTRIRRDSITNLNLSTQAAEAAAASRQRQLWFVLAFLAAVACGLLFAIRESRRRKSLNEELAQKNARISLLNTDINHRTNSYLFNIVKLLEEQKYKLKEAGAAPRALDELERQTLVYTKLQRLLSGSHDQKVVSLKQYLQQLTTVLLTSFQGGGMPIQLDLQVDDVDVDPKLAAPLALILNELMTNTAKYAARRGGITSARFQAKMIDSKTLLLNYEDDGPGNTNASAHFSSNTGLDLIEGLTHQMEAEQLKADGYAYRARVEL